MGWKVEVTAPDFPRCLVCVAPHTSNWDFVMGKLTYWSVGRRAGFLMKSSWFFGPLGYFFRSLGGVPVYRRNKKGSLVQQLVERFGNEQRLCIAITPEGTRSRNPHWHTGFLKIAHDANIPILLGVLDYGRKHITVNDVFYTTGDIEADLKTVKEFYRGAQGKYPHKFTVDDE